MNMLELRDAGALGKGDVQHQPAVRGGDDRDVRLEEPQMHARARSERGPFEVPPVSEAVVPARPGPQARKGRGLRLAPVRAHHEAGREAYRVLSLAPENEPPCAGVVRLQSLQRVSHQEVDPGGVGGQSPERRVEHLATDAETGVCFPAGDVGPLDPAVTRPHPSATAESSRALEVAEDPETFEGCGAAWLDEVPADALEGGRVAVALHQRDAQALAGEQGRGGAPRHARTDDRGVVGRSVGHRSMLLLDSTG
jgi:hypothetical protein